MERSLMRIFKMDENHQNETQFMATDNGTTNGGNTVLTDSSSCEEFDDKLHDWQTNNLATCLVDNVINELKCELGANGIDITSVDSTIIDNGILSAIAEYGLHMPGEPLVMDPIPSNNLLQVGMAHNNNNGQVRTTYDDRIHFSNDYLNRTFEETAVSAAIERKGLFLLPRETI